MFSSDLTTGKLALFSDGKQHQGDYTPVCPNDLEFADVRLKEIADFVEKYKPAYLLLEHLHFPCYWKALDPSQHDSCYCSLCIEKFRSNKLLGEQLPENLQDLVDVIDGSFYIDWLEFKCEVILEFIKELKSRLNQKGVAIKVGVVVPAWKEKDHGSGLKRLLGLDLDSISQECDFVVPDISEVLSRGELNVLEDYMETSKAYGSNFMPIVENINMPLDTHFPSIFSIV